eukprot:g1818.t1
MERRLRFTMLRLFLFASFVGVALAGEWDCASTTGVFELSTDCTVSSQIVVTGSLNITGIPDANGILPKIIGGGSNRLFKVESGGELYIGYVNMTRGDLTDGSLTGLDRYGAAVFADGTSGGAKFDARHLHYRDVFHHRQRILLHRLVRLRSGSEDSCQRHEQHRPYLRSMPHWKIFCCNESKRLHKLDHLQRYDRSGKQCGFCDSG